jgi:hypothetical protein
MFDDHGRISCSPFENGCSNESLKLPNGVKIKKLPNGVKIKNSVFKSLVKGKLIVFYESRFNFLIVKDFSFTTLMTI